MNKIDFVIMWVDGSDKKWQAEKEKYSPVSNSDSSIYRYRDWDLLRYWFRGVEKFAPWVNKIHFVTWGHIPGFLDISNPKINIVKHEDFIPKEYLPTFSANTIELNLHRIDGLSENFVLFNDDLFLLKKVTEKDFFIENIPLDTVALNVHCPKKSLISQYFCINDVNIINEYFDMKKSIKENFFKWFNPKNGKNILRTLVLIKSPRFPGFYQHHLTNSYNKQTFIEVWEKEKEILNNTCSHKFRETTDVNQWLMKEWQIAKGNFKNRSIKFGKTFYIDRDGIQNTKKEIVKYISKQKGKMIAINDGPMSETEFTDAVLSIKKAFEVNLNNKSKYEK
ncbi:MAG: Stealth CR1 domain-containing protein [Bacilli bacterium]|nr:Stealth CR1 domain-containing protein [Bacilli bacterium]